MANESAVDGLMEMEVGRGIDFSEFEGNKIPVEEVSVIEAKSDYDVDGKLITGLQRPVKLLRVITEPVTVVKNKEGKMIEIRASELFNLKESDGKLGFSKHPDSKVQKLLKKYGVKHPKDLKGKKVMIMVRTKNDKQFFGIAH